MRLKLKLDKNNAGNIFGKVLLLIGTLAFLFYGLSFFLSKPTVETITTGAPQSNSDDIQKPPSNVQRHNVKFQGSNRKN